MKNRLCYKGVVLVKLHRQTRAGNGSAGLVKNPDLSLFYVYL